MGLKNRVNFLMAAGLCANWAAPIELGKLDIEKLAEQSGLVVSRKFNRLYHINDSGDGPYFYITEQSGAKTRKIAVDGFKPFDTEDLTLGPCPKSGTCLAIGDIGDNRRRRKNIEVVFLEERQDFPEKVAPVAKVKLTYPDGAHNAEAFALLPNGDLVIVTKEHKQKYDAMPAQVFKAKRERLAAFAKEPIVLERIGEIDVPTLTSEKTLGGLVTGMSVTQDGERFVLLTYAKAVEFRVDLSAARVPPTSSLKANRDYKLIPIAPLFQQESVAYDTNDRDILYSSEALTKFFSSNQPAPLIKMTCNP